jgi:hypothetical protein
VRLGKIKCAANCVGFWVALQLFLFCRSVGILSVCFRTFIYGLHCRNSITGNVPQLGEVADLEALNFNLALMFI